jgi:hypothetical protein
MPTTRIVFATGTSKEKLHLDVPMSADNVLTCVVEPEEVMPFETVTVKTGATVYVNPTTIAYWYERGE